MWRTLCTFISFVAKISCQITLWFFSLSVSVCWLDGRLTLSKDEALSNGQWVRDAKLGDVIVAHEGVGCLTGAKSMSMSIRLKLQRGAKMQGREETELGKKAYTRHEPNQIWGQF